MKLISFGLDSYRHAFVWSKKFYLIFLLFLQ